MKIRKAKDKRAFKVLAHDENRRSKNLVQHYALAALAVMLIVGGASFVNADTNNTKMSQGSPTVLKQSIGLVVNPPLKQVCPNPVLNLKLYLDRSFNAYNDRDTIKNTAKKIVDMFSKRYGALEQHGVVNIQVLAYASYAQWQTATSDTAINIVDPANRDHQKQVIDNIYYTNNTEDAYVLNSRYNYVANQLGMDFTSDNVGAGSYPWLKRVWNNPGLNNISGVMVGLGQYFYAVNATNPGMTANMGVFVTRGVFTGNTGPTFTADELGPLVPGGAAPEDDQLLDSTASNSNGVEYGRDVVNSIRTGAAFLNGQGPIFGTRPPNNVVGILAGDTINNPDVQNNMNYVFGNRDPNSGNSGWFDENQIDDYFNNRIFDQLEKSGPSCESIKTKYKVGLSMQVGAPTKSELYEADTNPSTNSTSFPVTVKNEGDLDLNELSLSGGLNCKGITTLAAHTTYPDCSLNVQSPGIGARDAGIITVPINITGKARISNPQTQAFTFLNTQAVLVNSTTALASASSSGSVNYKLIKLPV